MPETESPRLQLAPGMLWDSGYRNLTRSEVTDVLDEIYDVLEFRVGIRLAEGLDHNQMAHFARTVATNDEGQMARWLAQQIPDYRTVVKEEFEYVLGTLREANAEYVSAAQSPELDGLTSNDGSEADR